MKNNTINTAMIEIFNLCPRAYFLGLYYSSYANSIKPVTTLKKCLLQGIAHINLKNITTLAQVQKYVGKHFPESIVKAKNIPGSKANEAFLYIYHCLKNYLNNPYNPANFEKVGVAAKLKSRVPLANIYLEEIVDLILWNSKTKTLEIIDFDTKTTAYNNYFWPGNLELVLTYLSQKLRLHYPYENLQILKYNLSNKPNKENNNVISTKVSETEFELNFPQLVPVLIKMNDMQNIKGEEYSNLLKQECTCKLCSNFNHNLLKSHNIEISA